MLVFEFWELENLQDIRVLTKPDYGAVTQDKGLSRPLPVELTMCTISKYKQALFVDESVCGSQLNEEDKLVALCNHRKPRLRTIPGKSQKPPRADITPRPGNHGNT